MNFLSNNRDALAILDSVKPDALGSGAKLDAVALDATGYALDNIAVTAAAGVQTWVDTEDMGSGEGSADLLVALMVGIADENKDGELSEDEQAVVQVAMNAAYDYMASKGVADADLDTLFNSDDPADANAAGDRVREFLADALPDGDEQEMADMDAFAFGADGQAPVFDGVAALDAVYKKRFAIRAGKKVVVRKRVAGTIRLSAKQKVAIRKMHMKSHGSRANARRMKSAKVGRRMGLSGR